MTKKLSDAIQLQEKLGKLVRYERELLNDILDLIIEAEAKRSFLELGHASLYTWLTSHFKYSESAAKRRIDAARLKKSVRAIEEKLKSGAVNLSTVSKAQSAIRAEELRTKIQLTEIEKFKVVEMIEGKTGLEAEKILMAKFPEAQIFLKERARVVSPSEISVLIVMTIEEYELFQRTKELLSHSIASGSPGKIVAALSREFLQRNDPLVKQGKKKVPSNLRAAKDSNNNRDSENSKSIPGSEQSESLRDFKNENDFRNFGNAGGITGSGAVVKARKDPSQLPLPGENSRYIPSGLRRAILVRDQASCQFRDAQSSRICGSRYQVELDHIQPWSLGGKHSLENLRCLCAQHNRHRATHTFGVRRADH